ncbi:hypothetical protein GCM10011360_05880 [Primorskyibacter flagellatus]|uniref:Uncharacterized protein n=1 Tax=Primorskyibacter flagellatus TaxID=1387277 RepID=A0A917EBE4_9RHOB|nr:hypothetical protein [Primorskyibacter flagellatus]GGE19970.1 hypothetical protein GCM10011360_05880 [Primorskyibacter flagellatus]
MTRPAIGTSPLTVATVLIAGLTGAVLLFDTGGPPPREVHMLAGLALAGVALVQVAAFWRPLQLYLRRPLTGFVLVMGVAVTVAGALGWSSAAARPGPDPIAVFRALEAAPVSSLAELTGKPSARLVADLNARGYVDLRS